MSEARPATERAPAKINLTLHVLRRRSDGYHELDSLVAFAALGDEVGLSPSPELRLDIAGPTAGEAGPWRDNLVLRAALALAERVPGLALGHFSLLKRLPVAAGLGGGSSDAAAALRLLARRNGMDPADRRLFEAAASIGADVPVCLHAGACRMTGAGEILSAPIALPKMPAVLVNPRVATPTAAVFRTLTVAERPPPPAMPADLSTREALLAHLAAARNDLETPAMAVSPEIGLAMALLRRTDDCRLVRMSGSGATVFALFDSCRKSAAAAKAIRRQRPDWWVRTTMIG